jgi:hypothetical protein
MSEHDDTGAKPGDTEFAARVAARLRESADSLDAQTRSRLNQARQAALDAMTPRPVRRSHWVTGAVTAALAVLAFMVWQPITDGPPPVAPASLDVPDFELLMTNEDLDMLEDLEFYTWLASTDLEAGAAG